MSKEKILVVGQGITGSVLIWTLQNLGHDVWVVDEDKEFTSSKVAAGLFNPILAGRRKISWMSDELFAQFPDFYKQIETLLSSNFFAPLPLLHLCRDIEEQNDWDVMMSNPAFGKWVSYFEGKVPNYIKSEHGIVEVNSTGWLNVPVFLQTIKDWMQSKDRYWIGKAELGKEIQEKSSVYVFNKIEFDRVFMCRGEFERSFSPFSYLPFKPAKGQVIDIETDFDLEEKTFHKQVFMLPLGKRKARVGSTFTWDVLDYQTTRLEEEYILSRLEDFLQGNYKISSQRAGVRPATDNRRPLVGEHPNHKRLYILNGLGSKAVSMAPHFAQMLLEYIYNNKTIAPEVDINKLKQKPF